MKRLTAMLLSCLLAITAIAQSSSQESKKAKLEKEIAILNKQLKENEKKSSSALNSLSLVRKKVSSSKKLVEENQKEIKSIDGDISVKEKGIARLQGRLDTLSLYYGKLIRSAYKNRDSRIWFMYVLSSDNLGQGVRRFDYFKNIARQMNVQAKKIQETKKELEIQREELLSMRKKAEDLRTSNQKELNKLKEAENQSQKIVNQLNRNKKKYQKQLAEKRKQVEALNKEIARMIQKGKSSKPVDVKLSKEFSDNRGKLPWPVEGSVIESFGQHYHPVYKSVKLPFNNGVNIATEKGASVKAVFNGEVRQVIVMPGYNQCVLVQHGGFFTFYCKLGSVNVKAGQKISTGQTIGKVETINGETVLHFQLWEDRNPQDPELWLR
ncbi:MAG: peptidoglycan DD-metalloendopeptidase family protein [Bacteroidales bacterium]|nr:peptidoglycan DD-metalloendopeptidase family protein [Bacteroidales bacterium]